MSDRSLVTGFPSFVAQGLVRRLLETDPGERVVLLCQGRFQVAAEIFAQELPRQARERIELLHGDAGDMDLGLPGADYRRLRETVTAVYHLADHLPAPPEPQAERTRRGAGQKERAGARPEHRALAGTRHILELCCDSALLRRLCHVSSAAVSGTRTGVVLEEELDLGQRFLDARDEALLRAEQLLRKAASERRLPLTVLRPGAIVGDSRSGEIDRFAGPYALMQRILRSPLELEQLLPHLGWASAPLHLCPIDFVIEATVTLGRDARAEGLTCHLVDPCPLSVRAVGELTARLADRKASRTTMTVPPRLLRAVLRAPGLERLARVPLGALKEAFGLLVFYNCQNTLRLLDGTGLRCPPAASYLDKLLSYMQHAEQHAARPSDDEAPDPLD